MSEERIKIVLDNIGYVIKSSFVTMGVVFSIMAVITTFISVDELLTIVNHNSSFWKIVMLLFISVLCMLGTCIYYKFKKSITIYEHGRASVTFEYGDMQKGYIKDNTNNKTYTVVIPINTHINEIFDEKKIRKNSNHGYWISVMKEMNYTESEIIEEIKKRHEAKVKDEAKADANADVCEIGETFYFQNLRGNVNYLLAVTCDIDEKEGYSFCTRKDYYYGIHSIVEAIKGSCNQEEKVIMPLIGGGYARMDKPERELVPIMAELLLFNADKLKHEVHVVIYDKRRNMIPIFNLSKR